MRNCSHATRRGGLRLPDPIGKRDKRLPFDRDQLHAIFNAPLYRGCEATLFDVANATSLMKPAVCGVLG